MRFEKLFVSLMIAILFIMGGLLFIQNQVSTYDVTLENEIFNNISNQLDQVMNNATTQKDALLDNPIGETDSESDLFRGGIDFIKNIWSYFGLIGSLIYQVGLAFSIPEFITDIFMIALMMTALMTIVYLIFRFQPK